MVSSEVQSNCRLCKEEESQARLSVTQVGPYRKCYHVQTRAHGHVLLVSLNIGIYHRRIYLMFTDQVHCMYRQFSAYTQLLCGL